MINELHKKYEDEVQSSKDKVLGFIKNDNPNFMPVKLGDAYKIRELDDAVTKLVRAEEKLAYVQKNFAKDVA